MSTPYAGLIQLPGQLSLRLSRRLTLVLLALVSFVSIVIVVTRFDAVIALAILAGIVVSLVMLVRPDLATLLTVFLLYINFPAILTKRHGVPHLAAGAFILLLAFPLLYALFIQRQRLKADQSFCLMLLLLGVSLLSSLRAVDTGIALHNITEFALEGLLLYWLIFNVVRTMTTVRRVIWMLLIAGALLSSLGLYQTVTRTYDQEFGGLAYRGYAMIQDEPERDKPEKRRTWDRAGGPLDEPNRFAQILIVLIPLGVFAYRNARAPAARVAAIACTFLIATGVLLTLSRGGFLGLISLVMLMTALRWIRLPHLIVGVLVLAAMAPWVPFFGQRMSGIARLAGFGEPDAAIETREIDSSSQIRVTVMLSAARVFRDHAFLGVGPGQFAPFYSHQYSIVPDVKFSDLPPGAWRAHSLYLELAAELGAVGLTIFLFIVAALLRRLWIMRRHWKDKRPDFSDLATAFGLSVIAYLVTGVFLHLSYQPYYWFLLAITGAALQIMLATRKAHEQNREATCSP